MSKFIGLSLSFCIADIINGNVDENDVSFIIAATCATNEEEIQQLITEYSEIYWSKDSERAIKIAQRFFSQKKIFQPRVQKEPHIGFNNNELIAVDGLRFWWIKANYEFVENDVFFENLAKYHKPQISI